MSTTLSVKSLCERALRKIGAFSINDDQADARELEETQIWFDLILSELSGTENLYWLVPETVSLPLVAGQKSYSLPDDLGADAGKVANGIVFPLECWLENSSGNRSPVEMMTRREFEELDETTTGIPTRVHIDRLVSTTLRIWPILGNDVPDESLFLRLVVQTYTDTLTGRTLQATKLRAEWQKWAICALAGAIGNGPVRKLPRQEVSDFYKEAGVSLEKLLTHASRQHTGLPQITEFRDF